MNTPSDGKVPFKEHLKSPLTMPLKAVQAPFKPFNWHKAHKARLSMGDRAADKMRNSMGSWAFVFLFMVFLAVWAALNTVAAIHHWDEYPFILLNLFLSMLAALQGSILLIAAKRMDAVNAAMAEHDYQTNVEAKQEVEELMEMHKKQLKHLDEILTILKSKQ